MITCSDLSTIYTYPPLSVRIAVILQGTNGIRLLCTLLGLGNEAGRLQAKGDS